MGKIIKDMELNINYDDGSKMNIILDDFIIIGTEFEDDKVRVHSMDRIKKIMNAGTFLTHMEKVKENIENEVKKRTDIRSFNVTKEIFKYFDQGGIEEIKKAYKDGKFGELPEEAIEYCIGLLKDIEPAKEIDCLEGVKNGSKGKRQK